jgi:site-specific DNA recombinase
MIRCFAYTRVSTVKQGEKGVSLQEQHAAIAAYAQRHGIRIVEWFEERLTAAKRGRPLFTRMLRRLRDGAASGVVIHKIDRSARNLRDWAELGELIDAGVSVHFVNDGVDLTSRGGRLSADIQAVVASDYIRNLREETQKGIRGRLKQGLFPFAAPIGYVDTGSGNLKTVDPVRGPLIRAAFELYATGRYTLDTLLAELHRRGLTNRAGQPISRQGLSYILNRRFYTGVIVIGTTGESYEGKHEPIVSITLFQAVQARLARRIRATEWRHDFTMRGLFTCGPCGRILTGERQKGHVYYRCHSRGCAGRTFREEVLEQALLQAWPPLAATEEEKRRLLSELEALTAEERVAAEERLSKHRLQLAAIKGRLARLVDALVDGALDKETFNERKQQLLDDQAAMEALISTSSEDTPTPALADMFELANSAQRSYRLGDSAAKRELALKLCSSRSVVRNEIVIEPHSLLQLIANRRATLPTMTPRSDLATP